MPISSFALPKNLIFAEFKRGGFFVALNSANGVSHKLLSQQSLMPMFHSTETSSRLNGISSDTHSPLHLSRRLAFMVADFGSAFKYSACPTVPQSDDYVVTAPEVSLQPVTQGMPPMLSPRERAYPTVPQSASLTAPLTQGSLGVCDASNTPKSKCKPQNSHKPKSSSFRNLSSNEVRYKFREREKVKITFPAKPEANLIFDRDFVEVERNIL